MAKTLWLLGSSLVVDDQSRPVLCEQCPCDVEVVYGTVDLTCENDDGDTLPFSVCEAMDAVVSVGHADGACMDGAEFTLTYQGETGGEHLWYGEFVACGHTWGVDLVYDDLADVWKIDRMYCDGSPFFGSGQVNLVTPCGIGDGVASISDIDSLIYPIGNVCGLGPGHFLFGMSAQFDFTELC